MQNPVKKGVDNSILMMYNAGNNNKLKFGGSEMIKPKYPELAGEIAKRGMTKAAIAARLNIGARSLNNKLCGVSPFTWEEVNIIREEFFPDKKLEELFASKGVA